MQSVFWGVLAYAVLLLLPVALIVFVRAIPNGISPVGGKIASFQQRYLQFNLQTLFWLTTLVGIVFGIGRLTGVNLLLIMLVVTFALLYCCGPWTALLVATSIRFWQPHRERLAGGLALLALLAVSFYVGTMLKINFGMIWGLTCILWTPQIVLYLLLRPLLLPLDRSEADAADLTAQRKPPPLT